MDRSRGFCAALGCRAAAEAGNEHLGASAPKSFWQESSWVCLLPIRASRCPISRAVLGFVLRGLPLPILRVPLIREL